MLSKIQHSENIWDIILTTKNWKQNEKYMEWEILFFNLQKSCSIERFSQWKGVTLEVN